MGLSLGGRLRHEALESLIIQSGGLDRDIVAEVISLDLPNLRHLELWLGSSSYGWNGTLETVKPILDGGLFPKLVSLGLRNAEITDQIAAALRHSPLVQRLEVLDLSLGTLSDLGAGHFFMNPAVKRLRRLDLHRHYCSPSMTLQLQAELPNADVSGREEERNPDDRYVAVGE